MNEEIDESDFYHQDFTTASEWEIFMARMEEIMNQWKTDDIQNESMTEAHGVWEIKIEKLTFADFDFNLLLYRRKLDNTDFSDSSDENEQQAKNPIDTQYDFEFYNENDYAEHSCLAAWYGIDEYYVLSPHGNIGITSESKIKVLLSSVYIVSSNMKCEKPIFIQVRDIWQSYYLGVYEGGDMRTNFEMVHFRKGPIHYQYLAGLLDLFKTKIISPSSIDSILVSVQHSYNLTEFGSFYWRQDPIDNEHFTNGSLPFGVTVDPINRLVLKTTWHHLTDNLIVDSEGYSDFDPMAAPEWSCLVKMTEDPVCLLGEALNEFLQNISNNSTVYDILGDYATLPSADSNPLDVLTEPAVPTISTLLSKATRNSLVKNRRGNPPISENVLVGLLYFLFPDADEGSIFPYGGKEDKELWENASTKEIFKNLEEEFKGFKTCGVDSLTWRLSIVLSHSLQSLGGVRAFAHLWYEFVQEMRYRWEKSMPIPGLSPGFPDLRTCLLNQKLQMLNCCIDRKISRENLTQSTYDSAEDSFTDDEFFDCSEMPTEDTKKKEKLSLWNQPVGRLSKFGDSKLLKTGDPLYIPVTQEPVLKTEDQLQEDTDVLLQLGSNAEATELRARIMSASLLSDMESFKAANPNSIVEDFIRWYSPRDWIEEEDLDEWGQNKGHLSPRMMIEDNNIWVQMWEAAKPVPANRQKRLFDDTREAEKVLQFLDFRTISQICELTIPALSHCAIYRLVEECQLVASELTDATVRINSLLRHGERLSRDIKFQPSRYEAFIQGVNALELLISQINSLQYKLNPSGVRDNGIAQFVGGLVAGKEMVVENKSESDVGSRITSMFMEAQKIVGNVGLSETGDSSRSGTGNGFSPPTEKEFVLRVNAVKPAVYSAKCPQFLRAILNSNEFRLIGAFSEDIAFF